MTEKNTVDIMENLLSISCVPDDDPGVKNQAETVSDNISDSIQLHS